MDKQKGDFVFECDGCGETLVTHTSNFDAARNMLRLAGWQPRKNTTTQEWEHYCSSC